MTDYDKLTHNSKKVQVESAIRDGDGRKISTNYVRTVNSTAPTDGNVTIDLSGYATTTALETGLSTKQGTLTAGTGIAINENNVISATNGFKVQVVAILPEVGDTHTIYLVPRVQSETGDVYDEYVYAEVSEGVYQWEKIGTTAIDLSNYSTKPNTIKSLSISGTTLTYTKGDNTTGTLTTQDTVYTHPASGVTAGTYKSVTVDTNGHVTAGTNPTTLSGYGITDANITDGVITLGENTITPLTSHQSLGGYLPLTAGSSKALTGDLYLSGSTLKGILSKDALKFLDISSNNYVCSLTANYTDSVQNTNLYAKGAFYINLSDSGVTKQILDAGTNSRVTLGNTDYSLYMISSARPIITVGSVNQSMAYLSDIPSVTANAPTLAWGTTSTIGTVGGTSLTVTMPANPNTDTMTNVKNLEDTKLWLVGSTTNPSTDGGQTTNTNANCYISADNELYSNGTKVSVEGHTHSQYLTEHQDITGKVDKIDITADTAGSSSATSGNSVTDIPYVTYNAQGQITAKGVHTHTIIAKTTTAIDSLTTTGQYYTASSYTINGTAGYWYVEVINMGSVSYVLQRATLLSDPSNVIMRSRSGSTTWGSWYGPYGVWRA